MAYNSILVLMILSLPFLGLWWAGYEGTLRFHRKRKYPEESQSNGIKYPTKTTLAHHEGVRVRKNAGYFFVGDYVGESEKPWWKFW
jgi:hypothetical protein